MELPILLIVVLGGMWMMSSFARKQQRRMAQEQARRTEEALVPGTWVRTTSGFYGTVVEIDGDAVTLATPLGDETLWDKRAIAGAEEPPFASASQDQPGAADEAGAEEQVEADRPQADDEDAAEETADKA
ncbi:preprotein translocase subunit YajC [Actinomyces bowdenii]|uniref:Preprotein translocase subunit YajC n=1 Tax=Actinomyces bowdenii TaxID=131109 RepID=A0A3P1URU5_9ACTO|nr:preprotein translocase subunit YajC [Actinomyces bowdenii]MBO3725336.1 preprotein translocase subunit YajC [Actinomyces bowdenii]RRD24120.1 preprotein translocase subunit YajC [Actinomyces bowdenii]